MNKITAKECLGIIGRSIGASIFTPLVMLAVFPDLDMGAFADCNY
jgi:hypothetical protein